MTEQKPKTEKDPTEYKRRGLISLYEIFLNYPQETPENQKIIREDYNKTLRYKNAFYRDRKTFEQRGNPLEWSDRDIDSFKVKIETAPYIPIRKQFVSSFHYSPHLVTITVSKECDIALIIPIDDYKAELAYGYKAQIKSVQNNLFRKMLSLDNRKGRIPLKRGSNLSEVEISYLRFIYIINLNGQFHVVSTNYCHPEFVRIKGLNEIETFLRKVIHKEGDFSITSEYDNQIMEEDFYPYSCRITRIDLEKRTNIYQPAMKRLDYVTISPLKSFRIGDKPK